jgi:hypothetical protein
MVDAAPGVAVRVPAGNPCRKEGAMTTLPTLPEASQTRETLGTLIA